MCKHPLRCDEIRTFTNTECRFMSFHPPCFLVKVNIEMSMAELILKIAKSKENGSSGLSAALGNTTNGGGKRAHTTYELDHYSRRDTSINERSRDIEETGTSKATGVVRTAEVRVDVESLNSSNRDVGAMEYLENDEQPLRNNGLGHRNHISGPGDANAGGSF